MIITCVCSNQDGTPGLEVVDPFSLQATFCGCANRQLQHRHSQSPIGQCKSDPRLNFSTCDQIYYAVPLKLSRKCTTLSTHRPAQMQNHGTMGCTKLEGWRKKRNYCRAFSSIKTHFGATSFYRNILIIHNSFGNGEGRSDYNIV